MTHWKKILIKDPLAYIERKGLTINVHKNQTEKNNKEETTMAID
jgi:hypothetical protein